MGFPDHESIFGEQPNKYDWMETVYGCPTEEIPEDAPEPKETWSIHQHTVTQTYYMTSLWGDLQQVYYIASTKHPLTIFRNVRARSNWQPMATRS